MPLDPADIAFDVGDNPTQPAPNDSQKKILAKNLSLAPLLIPKVISGNAHTMVADDEGAYLLFESPTLTTLTLINFTNVGQGFMVYIDPAGAVPALGTLPTGMVISAEDQSYFNSLEPNKRCAFYCAKIAVGTGYQTIHII